MTWRLLFCVRRRKRTWGAVGDVASSPCRSPERDWNRLPASQAGASRRRSHGWRLDCPRRRTWCPLGASTSGGQLATVVRRTWTWGTGNGERQRLVGDDEHLRGSRRTRVSVLATMGAAQAFYFSGAAGWSCSCSGPRSPVLGRYLLAVVFWRRKAGGKSQGRADWRVWGWRRRRRRRRRQVGGRLFAANDVVGVLRDRRVRHKVKGRQCGKMVGHRVERKRAPVSAWTVKKASSPFMGGSPGPPPPSPTKPASIFSASSASLRAIRVRAMQPANLSPTPSRPRCRSMNLGR